MESSVAVCIPTYNQAQYIAQSVHSALAQTWPHVEVWVSDDASTDETSDVLAGIRDPRLRVVRHPQNLGMLANTSFVLSQPDATYVVGLDSDDLLEPGYLASLIPLMDAHDRAGYGHTAVREIDEDGNFRKLRVLFRRTGFRGADRALHDSLKGLRTAANILTFRKAALEQVGYLRGRPDHVYDYDLSIRLADAGWGNVYLAKPLASYRVWSDLGGQRPRRTAVQFRGYARIFDESIAAAWRRRGWNEKELQRQRRRLASASAAACFAPQYSDDERRELTALLLAISDCFTVRAKLWMCRHGVPVAKWDRIRSLPKQLIKQSLFRLWSGMRSVLRRGFDSNKQGSALAHTGGDHPRRLVRGEGLGEPRSGARPGRRLPDA